MNIRKISYSLLMAITAVCAVPAARSADYPNRPIVFVVPFAAGTTTDGGARVIGQHMSRTLGQPVVMDNKVGASGTIAATFVSRTKPDGYTVLVATSATQVIGPYVVPNLPWDPLTSFAPIGLAAMVPQVMAVTNGLPVKNLRELVEYAKAHPGKLSYATLGPSTTASLSTSLFMQRAGISMLQVPYSSPALIYPDVISGRVDVVLDNIPNVLPHIKQGTLRPLGVTSRKRMDVLPDVPTIGETELPNFEVAGWFGLAAPAGTPPEVITLLNQALVKALDSPEFKQWLQTNGTQAADAAGPKQFGSFIQRELKMWKLAVDLTGVGFAK
jgi:tripartite-type tricarboxylate transporter receptor subunit TctC